MKILLTIIYICLTTTGIFLMKLGGDSLSLTLSKGITLKLGYITLLGFIAYLFSFLLWQRLIVSFDLSYIVPITTGICQLIILLIGIIFFKENINFIGIIGSLLVVIGIVLMAFGKKSIGV